MIGLGSIVVEKGEDLSDHLSGSVYKRDLMELANIEVKLEVTIAALKREKDILASAHSKSLNARTQAAEISQEQYVECDTAKFVQALEELQKRSIASESVYDPDSIPFEDDNVRGFPTFKFPPEECAEVNSAEVQERQAEADKISAVAEIERLESEKYNLERKVANIERELARGELKFPWDELTRADKDRYLYEVFPCLLLIGIAIKIGKTSATVVDSRKRGEPSGK